jgi:hypothetical protein
MADKGRRQGRTLVKTNTIKPKSAEQGMLLLLDEIVEKLNAIAAAIEASTDGDTLQAALDTAAIKAEVEKLKLR